MDNFQHRLDLAGISNLGSDFFLSRPAIHPETRQLVPNFVHLSPNGHDLYWKPSRGTHESDVIPPTLLMTFMQLATAPDTAIPTFAETWGVLGLCPHGLPAVHSEACGYDGFWGWKGDAFQPLATWRKLAAQARALLGLAADLQRGVKTRLEDWSRLCPITDPHPKAGFHKRWVFSTKDTGLGAPMHEMTYPCKWEVNVQKLEPSVQQGVVTAYMNSWIEDAKVRPMMLWLDNELPTVSLVYGEAAQIMRAINTVWTHPEQRATCNSDSSDDDPSAISFGAGNLFGILAIQLAAAFQSANGLYRCDGCGSPYTPINRRARQDKLRHFCEECGKRASKRLWAQRKRAQDRAK